MRKILHISLKLNFTPNISDCNGLNWDAEKKIVIAKFSNTEANNKDRVHGDERSCSVSIERQVSTRWAPSAPWALSRRQGCPPSRLAPRAIGPCRDDGRGGAERGRRPRRTPPPAPPPACRRRARSPRPPPPSGVLSVPRSC